MKSGNPGRRSKKPATFCLLSQFVKVSRPTIDLNYFLCSSTTSDFRAKNFDQLIRFYHEALVGALQRLGYPPDVYPLSDLIDDYNDCFVFGLAVGMFHAQVQTFKNTFLKTVSLKHSYIDYSN
jgi:hypothetical protein